MANNDLAIRFTEEKYATKSEVARDLKISSVDAFWNNIQEYRRNFYHYTPLKTIDKNVLMFCGCPSINGFVVGVENKDQYFLIRDMDKQSLMQGYFFYAPLELPQLIEAVKVN